MDVEQRNTVPRGRQERDYPAQFEVRGLSGGSRVELVGYASTYNQPYQMWDGFGDYQEVARAGMCAKALAEGCDVAYLLNHGGLTLARTKNGLGLEPSLRLAEDSTGLHTTAVLNTARSDVRDLVIAVEDGDITEMSFGFQILRQEWSPDYDQRDLIEVSLHKGDVSPVNYGANPATSLEVVQRAFRSKDAAQMHRMAVEVQEGRLTPQTAETLARALEESAATRNSSSRPDPAAHVVAPLLVTPEMSDGGLLHLAVLRAQLDLERSRTA